MPAENYPPPRFRSDFDRVIPGLRYPLQVGVPAAGVDWSAVVPGGRSWRLHGGAATFTTSAAVGNRFFGLQATLAGARVWGSINTTALAAGGAGSAAFQQIINPATAANSGSVRWVDLPDFWLPEGTVLAPFQSGILPGDTWTAIVLLIEERWGADADINLEWEQEADAALAALTNTAPAAPGGPNG